MDPWNIIICTDVQDPFVVFVPEPNKSTLANLKKETCRKIINVSEDSLTFYCNEQLVPQGKPLAECSGIRNGVALLVTLKPLKVNVYCPHNDSTLHIEILRRQMKNLKVDDLRRAIQFKFGYDQKHYDNNDILAMSGNPLTNTSALTEDCLLTYTRIEKLKVPSAGVLIVPLNTTEQFASRHDIYNQHTSKSLDCDTKTWTITIQQLDGLKNNVELHNPSQMPIFKLREVIKDALSVDTYQQKLIIRDVVLEDWDETGAAMMITHYPLFHDGVTVYLVQLVDGIKVNVYAGTDWSYHSQYHSQIAISGTTAKWPPECASTPQWCIPQLPRYINVHVPSKVQLKTLYNIMKNLAGPGKHPYACQREISCYSSGQSISPSDKPVCSVVWITNNANLILKTQPTKPTVFGNSMWQGGYLHDYR